MRLLKVTLFAASFTLSACGQSAPLPAPAASTAPAPGRAPQAKTVPAAVTQEGPEVAGGVTLAEGSVTDTASDGSKRQLKDGDEVYPGDSLVLGDDSYLDIDFTDDSRVLLRPDTTFQVQQYHFEPEAHRGADGSPPIEITPAKPENAFFSLVRGGLRAIDGLIGHTKPQNYGVETPVATIGVRGTAFDARYCGDDCKDEADTNGAPQNGLYTAVSDGSIGVKNDSGETVTKAGEYSFVKTRHEAVQRLKEAPHALRHMALPEKFKARDEKNRAAIKTRQQQRRQQIIQHRQQRLEQQKPNPAAAEKAKGKEPPAERREQRREEGKPMTPMEKRQQRREQMQEKREQGRGAVTRERPGETKPQTPAERREQRREERQAQRRQENAASKPAEKPEEKQAPADKARCRNKKYREKHKGECAG